MRPRQARAGRRLSVEVPAELLEALRAAADRGQALAELVRRTLTAAVTAPAAAAGPDSLAERLAGIEALEAIEARIKLERERLADLQAQQLEKNRARRRRLYWFWRLIPGPPHRFAALAAV